MRAQLEALRDGGEAIAAAVGLRGPDLRRFGYGLATRVAQLEVRTERAALLAGPRRRRAASPTSSRPAGRPCGPAGGPRRRPPGQPGLLDRGGPRWDRCSPTATSTATGPAAARGRRPRRRGRAAGYAVDAVARGRRRDRPGRRGARAGACSPRPRPRASRCWEQLLALDLVRRLRRADGPADVGVGLLLRRPARRARSSRRRAAAALVDVDRALAARRYAAEVDLVLDVDDSGCPPTLGRHAWRAARGRGVRPDHRRALDARRRRTDTLPRPSSAARRCATAWPTAECRRLRPTRRRRDDRVPVAAASRGAPTRFKRQPGRGAPAVPVRPCLSSARRRCPGGRR